MNGRMGWANRWVLGASLALSVGCGPARSPQAAKAELSKADRVLSQPLPSHDQRMPWEVFLDSNFYHESAAAAKRVWRSSRILGAMYLPQFFREPEEEREVNPMLKAKAARAEEQREAHREALKHRRRH